jgi:hypothetical protein
MKVFMVFATRPFHGTRFLAHLSSCELFSSPELKAQVNSSDHPLSGVRLSVCPSVNFYIFDFFSRTTGPNFTRLGTNHPLVKGIQVQKKGIALIQGEIIAKD